MVFLFFIFALVLADKRPYMIKRFTFSFLLPILFFSCSEEKCDIRVACDLTSFGNYLLKWETFPPMEGKVKIYESSNPDSFNMAYPIIETDIERGFADVLAIRNLNRSYFKLVFDKKYSIITSERTIQLSQIYNFRDLGGYINKQGKQVRWGKIYRSSSLAPALPIGISLRNFMVQDMAYLNNLGIRSLINLRTENQNFRFPCRYQTQNNYNFPLRGNPINIFFDRILSGEMKRNDVIIHLQDAFYFILEQNPDYFSKVFEILLEESNYPVVLYCSTGTDRTGIVSALILCALDIPDDTVFSDFLLSNQKVDYESFLLNADIYPDYVQETITALYSAHTETINYVFEKIIKNYGSLDDYFEKELDLTLKKRERLRELLLY